MSCLVENNYDPTEAPTVPPTQPSTPPSTTLAPTPIVSDLVMKHQCVIFVEKLIFNNYRFLIDCKLHAIMALRLVLS